MGGAYIFKLADWGKGGLKLPDKMEWQTDDLDLARQKFNREARQKARAKHLAKFGLPGWTCQFCGAVNMANDTLVVCFTCRDQGCPQCTVQVGHHFEHMGME